MSKVVISMERGKMAYMASIDPKKMTDDEVKDKIMEIYKLFFK